MSAGMIDKIERAKRSAMRPDPRGVWHAEIENIAHAVGIQFHELLEDWEYRARLIQYDGADQNESEARAFDCLREKYRIAS